MARPLNGWNQVFTLSRLGRMFSWMAFTWVLSGQSQPLSLIMCASSMMYLPSLYF